MQTGQLTIGTMILSETNVVQDSLGSNVDERVLQLVGRESSCDSPVDVLKSNIMGLQDKIVPVQFQYKNSYDGYYRVTNANVDYDKWYNGSTLIQWTLTLQRLGPDNAVDLESRVANVIRSNVYASTGERWHAPAGGHLTYFTGVGSVPVKLTRASADGEIAVYRAIPAGVNPIWGCPVTGYGIGRSRFLLNGLERISTRFTCTTTGWEMNNGLVRVKPYTGGSNGTIFIAIYDGTAWRELAWDVRVDVSSVKPVDHFRSVTVVRNDPECLTVRIAAVRPNPDDGTLVLIDMTLRRGSRLLEFYVQLQSSGTIAIATTVADPNGWSDTGVYGLSNGPDANGLTWVAGSSGPFSTLSSGGISKSALTVMDFFVSAVVPGAEVNVTPGTFETGVGTWTATGGTFTQASDQAKEGSFSGKLVVTGTPASAYARDYGNPAPAVAGTKYQLSFWARSLDGASVGVAVDWQNSGSYIDTSSTNFSVPAGVWTFLEYETSAAPTGTNSAVYGPTLGGNPPTGETLWVDKVKFRQITPSGDKGADLFAQYIGAMAEKMGVVRR